MQRHVRRLSLHFLKLSVLRRASEQSTPRTPAFLEVGPALRAHALAATLSSSHACLEFDNTLGSPGEGPLRRGPQESDAERARRRAGMGELPEGRPIAPTTDPVRKRLLQQLDHWVLLEGRPRLRELVTSLFLWMHPPSMISFGLWPFLLAGLAKPAGNTERDSQCRDFEATRAPPTAGTRLGRRMDLEDSGAHWPQFRLPKRSRWRCCLSCILLGLASCCDAHRCRLERTTEARRISARLSLRHRLAH